MTEAFVSIGSLVTVDPEWRNGFPYVTGKKVTVATIARLAAEGATPEQIASDRYPVLVLAEVHAALAFYHANRAYVDGLVAAELEEYDRAWAEHSAARRRLTRPNVVQ